MTCQALDSNPQAGTATREPVRLMEFVGDFGVGGTERQFVNLGLALDPSRFALWFGCLHRWGHHLGEIGAHGVPILDYGVLTFKDPRVIGAQLRLARDIRRFGIQIVHTYNFYANVFAIPAAKIAGSRVVASIRDMGVYLSPKKRLMQRHICRLADRILVNASAIRDWLIADGYDADRITVIPNGIDLARFEQPKVSGSVHAEFGIPIRAPLVGVVGRVTRFKGLEDFLKAAATIALRYPTAHFLIVGEGIGRTATLARDEEYRQELKQLAAQLGIQDRVVFTGFRADVERIFASLSVSVQPSLSEGLSNVVLESMATGLPVVATRVGGTSEAVEDGVNGLLVPPGDPAALAQAVCGLLAEPTLAASLGAAARSSVMERFSIKRLATTTGSFYESLLHGNVPRPFIGSTRTS
jgi:glycosyltransferase involved in cell wall biosynthesis